MRPSFRPPFGLLSKLHGSSNPATWRSAQATIFFPVRSKIKEARHHHGIEQYRFFQCDSDDSFAWPQPAPPVTSHHTLRCSRLAITFTAIDIFHQIHFSLFPRSYTPLSIKGAECLSLLIRLRLKLTGKQLLLVALLLASSLYRG